MAHRVGHEGRVGVVHDGGKRSVVVQEHNDLLSFGKAHDLIELAQSRRMPHLLDRAEKRKINKLKPKRSELYTRWKAKS